MQVIAIQGSQTMEYNTTKHVTIVNMKGDIIRDDCEVNSRG